MIVSNSEYEEKHARIHPGESIDGTNAHVLLGKLLPLMKDSKEIIIDLQNTRTVTSKGLAALLDAAKVMGAHGRLHVTNADRSIIELLRLTGLDQLLALGSQDIPTRRTK